MGEIIVMETGCRDCNNIFYTLKNVKIYHRCCPYCLSENINDNIRVDYFLELKK